MSPVFPQRGPVNPMGQTQADRSWCSTQRPCRQGEGRQALAAHGPAAGWRKTGQTGDGSQ